MTPAAWVLVAAALLAWPSRAAAGSAPNARVARPPRPARLSGARGPLVAAAAVALACLVAAGPSPGGWAAAVLAPGAGALVRAVARLPSAAAPDRSLALALDLAAAALRAGRTVPDALDVAAPAAAEPTRGQLAQVAGLLRLGSTAERAWAAVPADGPLAQVAPAATRSAHSGLRVAATFERLAVEIRADATAQATVRAHRAGTAAIAPLGACFLPAFVCLGVVPVVVGLAGSAFGGLR